MNELTISLFETLFNIAYLAAVWVIVIQMTRRMPAVSASDRKTAGLLRVAFVLLAAGDTGHVGFRVFAHLAGGTATRLDLFGSSMSVLGLGMLTTSVTVTLFYMLMVYVWRMRYNQPSNAFTNLLLFAGLLRLMLIALPGNDWGAAVPPQPISLIRNIPLLIQGAGVIFLFLRSAQQRRDTTFQWIGWMIIVSFGFYLPVIVFARQVPLIGMLMIPKTCAYLAVAWIAYRGMWQSTLQPA